jgi:RNA polymerase sigma-70 factor (ECF subfamily)
MADQTIDPKALADLVVRSQDGDAEAFGKIYDAYLTPVYRYVVFRFPEDLAEDLVADIFVKAWEKLYTYRPVSGVPFSAWLFRIARHSIIDAYRSTRGFDEIPEEMEDANPENHPANVTERKLSVALVRKALGELPQDYRDVLLLHFVAGLGHEEVALALKMTEGNVRQIKFRGLKKLKELLPPEHQS